MPIKEKKIYGASADSVAKILGSAFSITVNANDFFAYCCADAVEIDVDDLYWIGPIVEKYGNEGLNACMSFIRKQKPIKPYITKNFKKALKELEKLNPEICSE